MSRDPLVEGKRWVTQAQSDLADASYLFQGARYATACFLCQQAAEKALKGVLYTAGADAVIGHGVGALCAEAVLLDPHLANYDRWAELDLYYIPTRYPDALPSGIPADSFSERQTADALEMATAVVNYAVHKLACRD